jgi:hypothetical protein
MREIKRYRRNTKLGMMMTGRLVSGMPYLRLDVNTNRYSIAYWVENKDAAGRWVGSDWYCDPDCKTKVSAAVCNDFPKAARTWELPGIKYPKPNTALRRAILNKNSPNHKRLVLSYD